jgi:3-oxoacyl-(acyl-carrier-protein) synthase
MEHEVAIVGYDCLSPLGTTLSATWKELIKNQSGITFIDRYDPSKETHRSRRTTAPRIPKINVGFPKELRWMREVCWATRTLTISSQPAASAHP